MGAGNNMCVPPSHPVCVCTAEMKLIIPLNAHVSV